MNTNGRESGMEWCLSIKNGVQNRMKIGENSKICVHRRSLAVFFPWLDRLGWADGVGMGVVCGVC
jgi:hypothetical protein